MKVYLTVVLECEACGNTMKLKITSTKPTDVELDKMRNIMAACGVLFSSKEEIEVDSTELTFLHPD